MQTGGSDLVEANHLFHGDFIKVRWWKTDEVGIIVIGSSGASY